MKHYRRFFALVLVGALLLGCAGCGGGLVGDDPTIRTTGQEPVSSLGEPEVTEGTGNSDPYADIIKSIIKPYEDHPDQLKQQYYALYDIDGDGTKELLLGSEEYSGIVFQAVHAIQNGVAVWQEALPSLVADFPEQRSILKNGIIRVKSVDSDNGSFFRYYRFEDEELKLQIILLDSAFGNEYYRREYGNKDVPVTKEEFDRMRKEMEGDGQVVNLDWKPLAEYGR